MANLGWIKFGIAADTTKFYKSMHSVANELKHMAEAYVGFEALKAGAERLKEYVGGAIEGVSQTKILAERVGLSAESFGQLSYAAKLAHVGQDEFSVSLEQMNKRLGEVAIEGSGPAADALKRFGLSGANLAKMGTEQAFFKLLGVMEEIHNPAERAAVAMDLFGKAGQGMINLVAKGGDEIKAMGAEASRLGIALNDIDAAKVEEAEQAFVKLQAAGQGFANLIVTQLSPFIVELIDRYVEWGYQGTKSASFVTQGLDWVTTGLGYAIDGVNLLKAAFYGVQSIIAGLFSYFVSGIEKMIRAISDLLEAVGLAGPAIGDFFHDWSDDLERLAAQQVKAGKEAFEKVGKGHQTARNLVDDIQQGASSRAAAEVAKNQAFIAPGALHSEKNEPPKFAGAVELGSKDAYSSILRSRYQGAGQTEQKRIVSNTERGAAAGERSVALLQAIADGGRKAKPLTPHLPAAF